VFLGTKISHIEDTVEGVGAKSSGILEGQAKEWVVHNSFKRVHKKALGVELHADLQQLDWVKM
jgi:hypothetical protein